MAGDRAPIANSCDGERPGMALRFGIGWTWIWHAEKALEAKLLFR